jgi:protein-S-isoprenylcysteine O-methyltransferase Ste14
MISVRQLIVFAIGSILLILFSWFVSIREKRYHSVPRFFAFEGLLLLGILNGPAWFKDPLVVRQLISWILLLSSLYYAVEGFRLIFKHGNPGGNFENTTRLVTSGLYRYIRHPMYASLLFLGWGIFLKQTGLWSLALIIIVTIALFITCRVEEKEMTGKFGDEYRIYIKNTRMWIPFLL